MQPQLHSHYITQHTHINKWHNITYSNGTNIKNVGDQILLFYWQKTAYECECYITSYILKIRKRRVILTYIIGIDVFLNGGDVLYVFLAVVLIWFCVLHLYDAFVLFCCSDIDEL